jgi:hypothetical protein
MNAVMSVLAPILEVLFLEALRKAPENWESY